MEFEYLILADAANNGPAAKLNILGAGARVLTYERLPSTSPLVLLASVTAYATEAGEYPVEVAVVEPDGSREVMFQTTGRINSEVNDDRLPTGMGLVLNMLRPFRLEGVHRFEVTIGDLVKTYDFAVRIGATGEVAADATTAIAT